MVPLTSGSSNPGEFSVLSVLEQWGELKEAARAAEWLVTGSPL